MMRGGYPALVLLLALGGCGNSFDMDAREITVEYPPNETAAAQANADAQCKAVSGKAATLKGVETHGNVSSAVYSCS